MGSVPYRTTVLIAAIVVVVAGADRVQAQMQHRQPAAAEPPAKPPAPIRTTMEALHVTGGVPKGWKFLMPPGDPGRGREAFVALECYACHAVGGEEFPKTSKRGQEPGPDLTGMGAHHPPEYFAESIVNPNRVIITGRGYAGTDGLSNMPSYADVMTVAQLTDLVAYLGSLKGGGMHDHGSMNMPGHDMKGSDSMKKK